MKLRPVLLAVFCALGLTACVPATPPSGLHKQVDLARYSGRWYIIANIPYFAERGNVASWFDVTINGDRGIDRYVARERDFAGKEFTFDMKFYVVPGTGNAYWRETPLWPIYLSYLIHYVDADYRTALVGYPGGSYGWIMARTPELPEVEYQALLARFGALGYDTTSFRKVPQTPGQIGKPGFQ